MLRSGRQKALAELADAFFHCGEFRRLGVFENAA
jgi:hypothetical protein